jgi:leucyl aminopeptidase
VSDFGFVEQAAEARPLHLVPASAVRDWMARQPNPVRNWLSGREDRLKAGVLERLPGPDGAQAGALAVTADEPGMWAIGDLGKRLGGGDWTLDLSTLPNAEPDGLCLGWALGTYEFDRYRKPKDEGRARLIWPEGANREAVLAMAEGVCLARDLINTPAEHMGPSELESAARNLTDRFGGATAVVAGDDLLAQNFPMIHAVGRAADDAPRLIDLTFGDESHPRLTLVGKGVCFDTGGLDLKPASGMELMRKDMGGAATVLGLSHVILSAKLPVRLRVLISAVENAVAGNAYRPGDILQSRKGLTVEIGNTDAEGRLVMADALALACEESPDLLIDMATLTGAARVAVGTEIAAFFARDDALADAVTAASRAVAEPVWRLPLHDDYRHMLDTPFADINNAGSGRFAGATTAALFLKEFVADPDRWLHFDIMAWNSRNRPGRPRGGEAMGLRALFHLIRNRYA